MAPLKSLQHDHPVIDSDFLRFCASHGIFTVEDFLLQDIVALSSSSEKQFNSERLKQGIDQIFSVIDGMHLPWLNGIELLESKQHDECVISQRFNRVSSFLHGLLQEGFVTELVGLSSSGKTQVCLAAAVTAANMTGAGVVFIDTGNSFSAHRVAKIATSDVVSKDSHRTIAQLMSNISCYHVFDIFTLLGVLHQIESELKSQTQMQEKQGFVQLLIVDSMSSLISPVLGGSGPNGHALMISVGYYLKKLAIEYNLSVLVTNHMVSGEGGLPKPALGESWKTVPHVRVLLSRDRDPNICNMSVLRHPSMALKVIPVKIFEDL